MTKQVTAMQTANTLEVRQAHCHSDIQPDSANPYNGFYGYQEDSSSIYISASVEIWLTMAKIKDDQKNKQMSAGRFAQASLFSKSSPWPPLHPSVRPESCEMRCALH